jgi:hypothetical protein
MEEFEWVCSEDPVKEVPDNRFAGEREDGELGWAVLSVSGVEVPSK